MSGSSVTPPQEKTPPKNQTSADVDADKPKKRLAVASTAIGTGFVILVVVLVYHPPLSDLAALITALATLAIAAFTFTLWDATREIRESADATAERQFAMMEAQRVVMADQQTAMEGQVSAMDAIAKSVAESAEAAKIAGMLVKEQLAMMRRQHVANNLPLVTVEVVNIDYRDDTNLFLHFRVGNFGNTVARITGCRTCDGFHQGDLTKPTVWGTPISDHPRIVGESLPHGELLPGVHTCNKMNVAYHAVSGGSDFFAGTTLLLDIEISYDDEVGDHRGVHLHLIYEPLSKRFGTSST